MQDASANIPGIAFSDACERNRDPILGVLRTVISGEQQILEVGSGTGQHAVYFASKLPGCQWQPTDTGEYLSPLRLRLAAEAPANVAAAVELDVRMNPWPVAGHDVVFSANTLHFMGVDCVADFFRGVGAVLNSEGFLVVYGPFNYGGQFNSASNADFDRWLKATAPERGVRDFEWVNELAVEQDLYLLQDSEMPANNRILVWRKITAS